MKRILILSLLSLSLFSQEIDFSIMKNKGFSTYTVESPSNNLKAKLDFPFEFSSAELKYSRDLGAYKLLISGSFLLNNTNTVGKDSDWKNENLTVYSESKNEVDEFFEYKIKISKELFTDTDIFTNFKYKKLDYIWSDTYEKDYVANSTSNIVGNNLTFEEDFYQFNIGLDYRKKTELFEIILIPSIGYSFIQTKDTHILRNFYSTQDINALTYSFNMQVTYRLSRNSKVGLLFNYEKIKDNKTDMKYYNSIGNYMTLPSSFEYENKQFGLNYIYSF